MRCGRMFISSWGDELSIHLRDNLPEGSVLMIMLVYADNRCVIAATHTGDVPYLHMLRCT